MMFVMTPSSSFGEQHFRLMAAYCSQIPRQFVNVPSTNYFEVRISVRPVLSAFPSIHQYGRKCKDCSVIKDKIQPVLKFLPRGVFFVGEMVEYELLIIIFILRSIYMDIYSTRNFEITSEVCVCVFLYNKHL